MTDLFEGYDPTYLRCRDLRHAWDPVGFYRGSLGGVHRWLICIRCGSERYDHWMAGRSTRTYDYAEGYQLAGNGTRATNDEVRQAVLAQATIYEDLSSLQKAQRRRHQRGKVIDLRDRTQAPARARKTAAR